MKVGVLSKIEDAESKELNRLGLVAGMFDELEIGETIHSLIKQDLGQRKVSIGQAVKAMLLNGLGFANQRLYLLPYFFEGKPIEQLFDGDICAADLNDDVMGRTLDALFTADVSNVYMRVAHKTLKILDLSCFMSHIDSTGSPSSHQKHANDQSTPLVGNVRRKAVAIKNCLRSFVNRPLLAKGMRSKH